MIDEVSFGSNPFDMTDPSGSLLPTAEAQRPLFNANDISADLKKYFFEKMEKKGFHKAERVYVQYLNAGFSPKAAITLTDRKFFPNPHEKGHGNYLKNVIGEELFKKEQAARKKKDPYTLHMQTKGGEVGQYLLGVGEMALGVGLVAAGTAVEIATCGALTVGVALELTAAAALVTDGFARTMRNRDIDPNLSPATWKTSDVYAPDRPLPRDPRTDHPKPETDAPHTELGQEKGRREKYPQAREFDGEGNWVRDIDFTDHGRPHDHELCPHQHEYLPNPTGGTPQREAIGKPVPEWNYP